VMQKKKKACTLRQSELPSSRGLKIKPCLNCELHTDFEQYLYECFQTEGQANRLCDGWNWRGSGDGNK